MRILTSRPLPAAFALVRAGQAHLARRGITAPLQRTGVPALGTDDLTGAGITATPDGLRELVAERFVITRLPGAVENPFLTRIVTPVGGGAGPIGEGKSIPARRITFDLAGLPPFRFAALTVQANEAILLGGGPVARGLQDTLVRDVTDSANAAVLSDDAASALVPAGFANGAATVAATGDLAADIRALFEALGSGVDPASLAFITDAQTAAKIGTYVDSNGALIFPECGVTGGAILNVPVFTTRSSPEEGSPPEGNLLLVDGSAVAYALDEIDWSVADSATVELSDAPTGDGMTPVAASQETVSLFGADLLGFKCVMRTSWKLVRSGAVAVLTGI